VSFDADRRAGQHASMPTPWLTWLPIVISLGAVSFTGMQWYDARNQLLLSTRPHVDLDTEYDPDEPPVGVAINNAGPGPALIKSVTFYVDRKSVHDADEAGQIYAKLSVSELGSAELDPDDTLAVGERVWLIQYRKPRGGKINQKNLEKFADFVEQHLGVEVTYCSIIREDLCWTKCSTKDHCR
jgi:hypothetical protein